MTDDQNTMEDPDTLTQEEEALTSEAGTGTETGAVSGEAAEPAAAPSSPSSEAPGAANEAPGATSTDGENGPSQVPHAALHEARVQLRETRESYDAKLADMQAKIDALTNPPAKEEPDVMPDPVVDPKEFQAWILRQQEKATQPVQSVQETLQKQQEQAQAAASQQALLADVQTQEKTFASANPDYYQAYDHLREQRVAELKAMAPGATDTQIAAQLAADTMAVVQAAGADGRNPAETFYALAKMRGYAAKAPTPEPEPSKVAQAAAASAAAASVGSAAGGSPQPLSLAHLNAMSEEELAQMSDEDFAKASQAA